MLLLPSLSTAQGTLSALGFGYPAGQISTRALGAGGSIAEFDPFYSTNPAAVSTFGGSALYVHAEPEYRSDQGSPSRSDSSGATAAVTATW